MLLGACLSPFVSLLVFCYAGRCGTETPNKKGPDRGPFSGSFRVCWCAFGCTYTFLLGVHTPACRGFIQLSGVHTPAYWVYRRLLVGCAYSCWVHLQLLVGCTYTCLLGRTYSCRLYFQLLVRVYIQLLVEVYIRLLVGVYTQLLAGACIRLEGLMTASLEQSNDLQFPEKRHF